MRFKNITKGLFVAAMTLMICSTSGLYVHATELTETEGEESEMNEQSSEESAEEVEDTEVVVKEEYTEKAWEEKQEKVDNSPRDLLEEYPDNGYNGYATYEEYLQSVKGDGITQEQIDQGYRVVDGYIYSPEELEGDASSLKSGAPPTAMTGYINFVSRVPEGIHEATYIDVINANTFEEYQAVMFEANKYSTDICLPAGNYYVEDGGLAADYAGYYYVEKTMFTVQAGKTKRIKFDIVDNRLTAEEKIHLYDRQNALEQGVSYEDYVKSRYGADYLEKIGLSASSDEQNIDEEMTETGGEESEYADSDTEERTRRSSKAAKEDKNKKRSLIVTIIFNLIVCIPVAYMIVWYLKQKNRPVGFDD